MSAFRHLLLLLWKNYKLQLRHPWVTFFELVVPCFFIATLVSVRLMIKYEIISNATEYESFNYYNLPAEGNRINFRVLYAPKNEVTDSVILKIVNKTKNSLEGVGFNNESHLVSEYLNPNTNINPNEDQNPILCGIIFEQLNDLQKELKIKLRFPSSPKHMKKKNDFQVLTWMTKSIFPQYPPPGPRNDDKNGTERILEHTGGTPGYYNEGFLTIQHLISMSVASILNGSENNSDYDDIMMQRFPYPPYIDDIFLLPLQFLFPVFLMFSFIYPVVNITKNLVIEKEKRLKESMKMMGLKNWSHWVAWFIKDFIWLAISVAIITLLICLKVKDGKVGVLNKSDPSLVYVYFLIYVTSCISFCFMLSTFFSKANIAAVTSGVMFLFTFYPYFSFSQQYFDLGFPDKMAICLLCNTALPMGIFNMIMWEGNDVGAQWSNLFDTASPDDTMSLGLVMLMLIVDSVIYLLITWYVEAVFPGKYGLPQKWYFFVQSSYWCGTSQSDDSLKGEYNAGFVEDERNAWNRNKSEFIEREPKNLKCSIKISNLSKSFDGVKYSVKDLNLNTYNGQITALLGHNGAGKTTTISMLTGLFPPTSGSATINGFDIGTDISNIHKILGICPQFDVLFDELTVEEHLYFYCKLKDMDSKNVSDEITRMIQLLALEDKRKSQAHTLSGGMKRKLSIGMALVGGSKIVILDEPTSGLDVSARRFVWDLLLQEKEDRCILLTTHFMEEADVLGDRIAIMANGELQCCGSPLFLKRKYGAGYQITIVKKHNSSDIQPISSIIHKHIINAKFETAAGAEVSYSLPNQDRDKFEALFTELESRKRELNIDSYGVSLTTMEDVFLKVGEYAEAAINAINANQNNNSHEHHHQYTNGHDSIISMDNKTKYRNTGLALIAQQFHSLFLKKCFFTVRNRVLTLSQFLIPVLIIIINIVMIRSLPSPGDSPAMDLTLYKFKGSEKVKVTLFHDESDKSDFIQSFVEKYRANYNKDDIEFDLQLLSSNSNLREEAFKYLVRKGENDMRQFNKYMPIAVMLEKNQTSTQNYTITSLFNNQAIHTPAISLAAIDLALMRMITNNPDYKLEFTNHPFPRTLDEAREQYQNESDDRFQISQNLIFAMAFLAASFAIFIVKERSVKGKHLQQICGLKLYVYWSSAFIWDFLTFLVPCLLVMGALLAFQQKEFFSFAQQGRLFLVFLASGAATLPFIYLLSYLFSVPSGAYVRLILILILLGFITFNVVTVMEIPSFELEDLAKAFDSIFSLIAPNYSMGRSVLRLMDNYVGNDFCNKEAIQDACKNLILMYNSLSENAKSMMNDTNLKSIAVCCQEICDKMPDVQCFPWNDNYFAWEKPGIGKLITFLLIQTLIFWIIITLIELHVFRSIKYFCSSQVKKVSHQDEYKLTQFDDDVAAEHSRIGSGDLLDLVQTDTLLVRNLTKYYGTFCAVDDISYGVKKGECFGLLGINGAGKTTTFKMITGDELITGGDIFINGYSVKKDTKKSHRQLGYCPQFDGLLEQLTGRETLELFCRLRGIKEYDIPFEIMEISKLLYFDMHLDKLVKNYSGGTKRKLSTAIALIGDPSVSFLDEPTTGVDPVARRCLWDALSKKLSHGNSIILTSHSMEECEALCNRLIIMVNGKICCIGSPQQLKNKFGKGYTVMIKVGAGANERLYSRSNSQVADPRRPSKLERQLSASSNEIEMTQYINEVKNFMQKSFPLCELKEMHNNLLHYHIADPKLSWAKIFGAIERHKERLNIEDYSVGQTTLEQIFLSFARQQRESKD